TRCKRDSEDVVSGGPPEVLYHLFISRPAQRDNAEDVARITSYEHDVARFHGDVGSSANCNAYIGSRQRRGVIDTVSSRRVFPNVAVFEFRQLYSPGALQQALL